MRKHSAKNQDDAAIDMTPMLDIVFIMLIFFIVTASFLKEAGIEVDRPEGRSGQPQEKANIMIAITSDDEVWMEKRRVDVRAVRANVERLKAENPEGTIVIQADEESSTGIVAEIMDSLNQAGFTDHVLATDIN
ncbi:biopolymer transporter ExbD [Emcibacteraceae bacterium]|jgi:biopolymer transport protein ExbD|nr:biopolymer transporter ExbD [Kordiimonadaceae bacterium]MDA7569043.1 biopolymer transporter ExbD [Emcibacteraceae bacterium]MDA9553862.1 biopolymer transporter ExbD [Emcibacteraceae bacterium]MDA9771495.1 biopolymer transporter ExbD [Emcibacteraceae bacterium]MDC1090603.1 biopolymer transporter ExbD [Emcibacteraceae bacterium]